MKSGAYKSREPYDAREPSKVTPLRIILIPSGHVIVAVRRLDMIDDYLRPPALHAALRTGDDAAAIRAIESGDDVNARHVRYSGDTGQTALHIAASQNNAAMIAILVENGADINAQTDAGITPLWVACDNRNFRDVQALLNCGADQTIAGWSNETPHRHVMRIIGEFVAIVAALEHHQRGEPSNAREWRKTSDFEA